MNRKWRGRLFRYTVALIALGVLAFLTLLILVSSGYYGPIPDKKELQDIRNSEASIVFDRTGRQLGKFYVQDRANLSVEEIPEEFKTVLVQIEDQRFYEHSGVDLRSLGRVFFKSILMNDASSGGGSTISQQLAKNIYPRVQHKYLYYAVNKLREMIIARKLEDIYSKDEILALYLNTVSFGLDSYGIEAASQRIFSKPAKALTTKEIATLVGMLKATTTYHPLLNPDNSLRRRNLILRELHRKGLLEQEKMVTLLSEPLGTKPTTTRKKEALYFLDQIQREAGRVLGELGVYNLKTDGLRIETTLDLTLQRYAEQAVYQHLSSLQQKFSEQLDPKFWEEHQKILDLEIDKVRSYSEEKRDMAVFTWKGDEMKNISQLDSIKHYLQFLQTGLIASDPTTGEVVTWVGGIDPIHFPYDHVVSKRQVGSTLKPFIYAAALENEISPCEYYETAIVSYEVDGETWAPGNSSSIEEERLTMASALEKSVNTVTVKILEDVGIDKAVDLIRASGITSPVPRVPSIALGTPSISLYEMVDAYGIFANDGNRNPLHCIRRITDKEGNLLYESQAAEEQVISSNSSQMMVSFLKEVANQGTGSELRSVYGVRNDVGGKTGTSQNNADGWFIGISPKLVVGVWVGGEYPAISFESSTFGQGARMALPIYAGFYQKLNSNSSYRSISQARFPTLDEELQSSLECDPFREELKFWNWLRVLRESRKDRPDSLTNDPRLIDKVRQLFNRRKK